MTPQQYIKQLSRPMACTIQNLEAFTGYKATRAELRELKAGEIKRRIRKGMTREQAATALGVKPDTLSGSIKSITGKSWLEYMGRPKNSPPPYVAPGGALDLTSYAFYHDDREVTISDICHASGQGRSNVKRVMAEALQDGTMEQVRRGVYKRRSLAAKVMRMPWAKGEAARLRAEELERMKEEEADRWARGVAA